MEYFVVYLSFFGLVRAVLLPKGVWTVACQRRSSEIPVFVRSVLGYRCFRDFESWQHNRITEVGHLVLRTVSFYAVFIIFADPVST